MERKEKLIEVLWNLVQVNNDRVTGYEKAAEQSKELDVDLHTIFTNLANESRRYIAELTEEIYNNHNAITPDINTAKIHNIWQEVNPTFQGYDRQALLESCELSEDKVQKAYNAALASDAEIGPAVMTIIINQKASLKNAHKVIKNYRDAHWKMIA
ncbi:MAG: PA2169 family four-helix-bundle protein [Ferruginibacter sp.]